MWNHSVNNCRGMLFTLLFRIGLCSCINKLSFKHNRKSFYAPPTTRKLSSSGIPPPPPPPHTHTRNLPSEKGPLHKDP